MDPARLSGDLTPEDVRLAEEGWSLRLRDIEQVLAHLLWNHALWVRGSQPEWPEFLSYLRGEAPKRKTPEELAARMEAAYGSGRGVNRG